MEVVGTKVEGVTMKNQVKSRIISASLLIVAFALANNLDDSKSVHMGREAYLANKRKIYDKVVVNYRYSYGGHLFASVVIFGGLFGVYELLTLGVLKVLEKMSSDAS